MIPLLLLVGFLAGAVVLSLAVEGLRARPEAPQSLYWDPAITIQYAVIDGLRIRYIKTGRGPNLVLLHTLRTQLDIFERLIPRLAQAFTVHALDYPGHGFSDIPSSNYRPEFFIRSVEAFLEHADLTEVTLAGVSIGGAIPLVIAAKRNPRVTKVVSINPYDYGKGMGIRRGNLVARLVFTLAKVPVLGETVMRLRNPLLERRIMEGGVCDPAALSPGFLAQVVASGAREGHYRAFLNLLRHAHLWEDLREVYGQIGIPVLVVYGDRDWSLAEERRRTVAAIPGVTAETVQNGGHFLPLDQPERLAELIKGFAYEEDESHVA
jgi:pimeloyl-ACP methyl ester carboxylesterase